VSATWSDQSDSAQRTLPGLTSEFGSWSGALDIAVGGTVLGSGENYASAAAGREPTTLGGARPPPPWRPAAARPASPRSSGSSTR
jgi:hypothetical protein